MKDVFIYSFSRLLCLFRTPFSSPLLSRALFFYFIFTSSVKSETPFVNVVAAGNAVNPVANGLFYARRRRLCIHTVI